MTRRLKLARSRSNFSAYGVWPASDILTMTKLESGTQLFQFGSTLLYVDMFLPRYQVFANDNCTCVKCGRVGEIMVRMMPHENNPHNVHRDPHFNLYAINEGGGLILMTVDHRIPKSKGGSDDLSNLQTMCHSCNHKKGSKIEDTSTYRGLARK